MKPYREWLSGSGFEANASLGGSFYSNNIEDYYQTPWDLGYGKLISWKKESFIGKGTGLNVSIQKLLVWCCIGVVTRCAIFTTLGHYGMKLIN